MVKNGYTMVEYDGEIKNQKSKIKNFGQGPIVLWTKEGKREATRQITAGKWSSQGDRENG